jgi:hypothetical protein
VWGVNNEERETAAKLRREAAEITKRARALAEAIQLEQERLETAKVVARTLSRRQTPPPAEE